MHHYVVLNQFHHPFIFVVSATCWHGKNLGEAQEKQMEYYDLHGHDSHYQTGEIVYLHKPLIFQSPLSKLIRSWPQVFRYYWDVTDWSIRD